MKTSVMFLAAACAASSAHAAQYYCIGPPTPCATLTQLQPGTWSFQTDARGYVTVSANGVNYGRAVPIKTYFGNPNSQIVPDHIFAGSFQ